MIVKPSRRDILKYSSIGLLGGKLRGQIFPFPGPGGPSGSCSTFYSVVSHVGQGLGTNGGTTAPINTLGADLLVVALAYYNGTSTATFIDSTGASWTLIELQNGSQRAMAFYYLKNPGVAHTSATHTITASGTSTFSGANFAAFSGSNLAGPLDQQNGTFTNASPVSPGSIAPTQNNELVLSALSATGTVTVDSSMIMLDAYNDGTDVAGGMAYRIQTTALSINPVWSYGSADNAVVIASFKRAC